MARVPDIKRIRKEDFPEEMQDTVGKLGYAINTFMDQVISLFSNNIDFQNLSQQVSEFIIETDGSGDVINPPKVSVNLGGRKVIGAYCIAADNLNDSSATPAYQPFIGFTIINNNLVSITSIKGLPVSGKFRIRVLLIT